MTWGLWSVLVLAAAWLLLVVALALAGRRAEARTLAGFLPDCLLLLRGLLGDSRMPWGTRALLIASLAYLASPLDLVPDFVPVVGQLDDALLLALVLRHVVRRAGADVVKAHWRGPPQGRDLALRLAGFT